MKEVDYCEVSYTGRTGKLPNYCHQCGKPTAGGVHEFSLRVETTVLDEQGDGVDVREGAPVATVGYGCRYCSNIFLGTAAP